MDAPSAIGETEEEKTTKLIDQEILADEQSESKETRSDTTKKEHMKNLVAFYAFGALIYTVYSVIISGAQDILAGTFIPTAAVLVTNVGPYFLVTMIAPYFIHKVPYALRIVAIYALFTAGLFIIVYAKEVYLKLVGICTTSLGAGIGEVSFFYTYGLLRESDSCCIFRWYWIRIYTRSFVLHRSNDMELCVAK